MEQAKFKNKQEIRAYLSGTDLAAHRKSQRKEKLQAFCQSYIFNIPIGILIVVSVSLVFCEILVSPGSLRDSLILANDVITWIFVAELSLRYYAAPNKKIFFCNYWIDIIAVLPLFRFFRTIRILRLLRLLRLVRVLLILLHHGGWLSKNIERHLGSFAFLLLSSVLLVVAGTLATLNFELPASQPTVTVGEFMERVWRIAFLFTSGELVGDLPHSLAGKIVSVFVSIAGLSIFAIFVGTVSATMTTYLRNSMDRKDILLEDLAGHIIICGWDSVGHSLLNELEAVPEIWRKGVVVVADSDMDITSISGVENSTRLFHVKDDFTKFEVLESVGARKAARALVLADSSNGNLSDQDRDARTVLAALTLEKINPKIFTCAELINQKNAAHLKIAGVEEIISRSQLTAGLFASTAVNDGVTAVINQILTHREGAYLRKLQVPEEYVGKSFGDILLGFKSEFDSTVIALEKISDNIPLPHVNPQNSTLLESGDKLIVLVTKNSQMCNL